jgi:phosphoglycolate phosphatase
MKKLILWDLDGTLINTLEDLAAAVDYALELRGLPTHSIEEYRKMVGHGVRNLVKQALEASVSARPTAEEIYFPQGFAENQISSAIANPTRDNTSTGLTDAYIDAALADFREYYEAHIDVHTRPYPGIPELLNKLNAMGVKMAVASNKFQEGTEKLIQEFFPDIAFVSILGNRAGYPLKPDPEIVQEVLQKAGIGPEDAMMVGDSPTDMKTAANGGIDALAVTWGYRTLEELAGNRMVHSVEELDSTLCSE